MFQNWLHDVKRWALHPYNENGTVLDWVLFVGLWVVATILWARVIRRLVD